MDATGCRGRKAYLLAKLSNGILNQKSYSLSLASCCLIEVYVNTSSPFPDINAIASSIRVFIHVTKARRAVRWQASTGWRSTSRLMSCMRAMGFR